MLLRIGLELADRIVAALPSGAAYALADLVGDAWRRLAPDRRSLVAANLARVCEATGRPSHGRAFDALVRSAFRHHARYYVELLRAPHYDPKRIDEVVRVEDWPAHEATLRAGPSMLVSSHLGNFEPFGVFLAAHGFRPLAPVEEIEPRVLFEFLAARRGGRGVELVRLAASRRALLDRLRSGGLVGIIGDRDITGSGEAVTIFGHPTTIPNGPAMLALATGASITVGRCLRVGPDRFQASGELLGHEPSGHRRDDVAALTRRVAARFEGDIAAAPEQWWGAFQQFWPDLGRPGETSATIGADQI
ncbi:MAG: lysophospholipid acyltransferase family protein [Candidatus Limnocylindria bacterium]